MIPRGPNGQISFRKTSSHLGIKERSDEVALLTAPPRRGPPPDRRAPPAVLDSRTRTLGCVALLFLIAIYVVANFWPVILDETEGQYAGGAREMLARHDWIVPTNDSIPRLQKPPLLYWLIRACLQMFGVNEFAARLPNALAAAGWIALIYAIGKLIGGSARGLFAAVIFASMIGMFVLSHMIMPEPLLGFTITLALYCFLRAHASPARADGWMVGAWAAMAAGVLAKGLHGALYPLAVAGAGAWFEPKSRPIWRRLNSPLGLALFFAVVAPWYILIERKFPGFLSDHFLNEQLGHVFGRRYPPDTIQIPLLTFWVQHLAFFFPWIFFAPAALAGWKSIRQRGGPNYGERLNLFWIATAAISITFSSRQDYYTMVCWGAVSIWLAIAWSESKAVAKPFFFVPFLLIFICGVGASATAVAIDRFARHSISVQAPDARIGLWNTLSGFSIGAWISGAPLLLAIGLILCAAGAVGVACVRARRLARASFLLALAMGAIFCVIVRGYVIMENYFSSARLVQVLLKRAPEGAVVCEGEPHLNSSVFFYWPRPVDWVRASADTEFAPRQLGIGAGRYLEDAQLRQLWESDQPVFFITDRSHLPIWRKELRVIWIMEGVASPGAGFLLANRRLAGAVRLVSLSQRRFRLELTP